MGSTFGHSRIFGHAIMARCRWLGFGGGRERRQKRQRQRARDSHKKSWKCGKNSNFLKNVWGFRGCTFIRTSAGFPCRSHRSSRPRQTGRRKDVGPMVHVCFDSGKREQDIKAHALESRVRARYALDYPIFRDFPEKTEAEWLLHFLNRSHMVQK